MAAEIETRTASMRFVLYAVIFIAGTVVGLWASDGAVWQAVAGPPDLGRADFSTGDRPQNQFVACAAADTGCTNPNLTIEADPRDPEQVLAAMDAVAAEQPRIVRVDDGSDPLHRRYVARTALLKFPDTIAVDAVPTEGGTALRISSRSQIGQSDFGVNGERVRTWLAAL